MTFSLPFPLVVPEAPWRIRDDSYCGAAAISIKLCEVIPVAGSSLYSACSGGGGGGEGGRDSAWQMEESVFL